MTTDNPLDDCQSLDEVFATILCVADKEGLRELCKRIADEGVFSSRDLALAADKLRHAGLSEGADIVTEAAEAAKDTPTLVATCPYDPHKPHYRAEFKQWMQKRYGEFGPASFAYLNEKYGPEFIAKTFRWGASS